MGVAVTSATTIIYGQAIWDPTDGLSRFKVTHLSPEKQIEGKGLPPVISPSQGRQQVNRPNDFSKAVRPCCLPGLRA